MKKKILITMICTLTLISVMACGKDTALELNKSEINTETIDTSSIEETTEVANDTDAIKEETSKEEISKEETSKEEISSEPETSKNEETSSNDKDVAGEIAFNVVDDNRTMYSTTSLNVRALPDANSDKIGTYSLNDEVNITGKCDNGWVRVDYNGATAYVKESYLSNEKTVITPPVQETQTPSENPQETVVVGKEGTYDENLAREAFDLVNQIRADNGLGTLSWDSGLVSPAKVRAAEASIKWSHTRPDGSAWYTVSGNVQGENLAKGYNTAQDAVNAWMASQGHKENILRGSFTRSAVAFFNTDNGWFWCQAFGY